ncbi:immunity 49 family protein [Kitasatospora sp. NBC_00070]|uniref:immunity 49 family protein n=1 Tax=Kitasatospora sp. NBC_00070 TaxID=2975962 RepID=UPI00324E32CC
MTTTVARHVVESGNLAKAVGVLAEVLDEELAVEPLTAWHLSSAVDTALILARKLGVLDPEAEELGTWNAYVRAMQASSGIFAAATADGSVECRIGREARQIPATGPKFYTDAGAWLDAFWLAVICRERTRLDMLSAVPVDVLRGSGAVFDEYVYAWVEALQAYWRRTPDLTEKLLAAIDGTDPDVARVADREVLLKLLYPPLAAFYQFLRRDQEKFDAALLQGLELHREFWSADEERAGDPDGFVSLPLLGIACLAYDNDVPVAVESGYLPKHLLRRSWFGEYQT